MFRQFRYLKSVSKKTPPYVSTYKINKYTPPKEVPLLDQNVCTTANPKNLTGVFHKTQDFWG